MRIHLKISKTQLEKTGALVVELIDELRGNLVFQAKKLWRIVSQKILLLIRREKCLLLDFSLSDSLFCRDAERVILF